MKIKLEGAIFFDTQAADETWRTPYKFFTGVEDSFSDYLVVVPHSFEVEIPDDFDPRPAQVAVLEAKRTELTAAFSAAVMEINTQISKLTAIGYDAPEAS